MTDDELRSLVRNAIARHLGREPEARPATAPGPQPDPAWRAHPSFGKYLALQNDDTGACMIEPSVQCNHCGFCLSHGH
jgi:hypothetical protein